MTPRPRSRTRATLGAGAGARRAASYPPAARRCRRRSCDASGVWPTARRVHLPPQRRSSGRPTARRSAALCRGVGGPRRHHRPATLPQRRQSLSSCTARRPLHRFPVRLPPYSPSCRWLWRSRQGFHDQFPAAATPRCRCGLRTSAPTSTLTLSLTAAAAAVAAAVTSPVPSLCCIGVSRRLCGVQFIQQPPGDDGVARTPLQLQLCAVRRHPSIDSV